MKKLNKIKTGWNLRLLYKNLKDPQIEKDMRSTEHMIAVFAKRYSKDSSYMKNKDAFVKVLQDYEKLSDSFNSKPILYP